METERIKPEKETSNLVKLVAGITLGAAALLPLAGCEGEYSYTYHSYSPPRRIVPYHSHPRYYGPPQRCFNNDPYGNPTHRNHPSHGRHRR